MPPLTGLISRPELHFLGDFCSLAGCRLLNADCFPMPTSTLNTLSFFVHRTRQIYSLPAVALEVLELTDHPRVDCRKLKQCIEHDPALVGKILRVVNSSLFGRCGYVSDLNQALALLGIKS